MSTVAPVKIMAAGAAYSWTHVTRALWKAHAPIIA